MITGEGLLALGIGALILWWCSGWVDWSPVEKQEPTEADFEEKKEEWNREHGEDMDAQEVEAVAEPRHLRYKKTRPGVLFIPASVDAQVVEIGGRWRITVDDIEVEED